jgi:hypothetical protein
MLNGFYTPTLMAKTNLFNMRGLKEMPENMMNERDP